MFTDNSLDLLDWWIQAGLGGGDWRVPLDRTTRLLGAQAMVLVRQDSDTTTLSVGSDASIDLVLRCRELARRRWRQAQQCYALHLGAISWASCETGPEESRLIVTVFALHAQRDHAALQSIAVIAACGLGVKARLGAIQATVTLKAAAFDQLPLGVAIVDAGVNLVEMNETCRAILARADGLCLTRARLGARLGARLSCRRRGDQAALSRAVWAALAGEGRCPIVQIDRPGAAEPYVVRAISLPVREQTDQQCLLMIADPESGAPMANKLWRALFDLSESELLVAEGIVAGRRREAGDGGRVIQLRRHVSA